MALKKICVCGHFGFGKDLLNGQTVKTKIITAELEKIYGVNEVGKIDTHGGIRRLLFLFYELTKNIIMCENIVFMPAQNGLKTWVHIILFLNIFFSRRLHYVVIGGWLPEFFNKHVLIKNIAKKIDYIYVETSTMKKVLEEQGFNNIIVMPNCKELDIVSEEELVLDFEEPYKLCTFSRVMKEKGIEDAVNAVKNVNDKYGKTVYTLDIFGQVDGNQIEWFEELKKNFPEYVEYKGCVPYDKSVQVLKDYFALLFPTYYEGEGFAGTILDAFASGLPVIVSDWKYNSEIVEKNVTGVVYNLKDKNALTKELDYINSNVEKWVSKRKNCLEAAEYYRPEKTVKTIISNL